MYLLLSLSCYCKDHSQLNHTLTYIKRRWLPSCHTDQGCHLIIQCIYARKKYLYSILTRDVTLCLLTIESSQTQHNNETAVFDCSPLSISTLWKKVNDVYAFWGYFILLLPEFYKVLQLNRHFKMRKNFDICNSFISPHQSGSPRLLHISNSICNVFYT